MARKAQTSQAPTKSKVRKKSTSRKRASASKRKVRHGHELEKALTETRRTVRQVSRQYRNTAQDAFSAGADLADSLFDIISLFG